MGCICSSAQVGSTAKHKGHTHHHHSAHFHPVHDAGHIDDTSETYVNHAHHLLMSILKTILIFNDLDDKSLELIMEKMTKETYTKDTTIFTEGLQTNTMYIIDSGSIQLSNHGQCLPTIHYHHGNYFNHFSLVSKTINDYTAFTTQATSVWLLTSTNFTLLMHKIGVPHIKRLLHMRDLPGLDISYENLYILTKEFMDVTIQHNDVLFSKDEYIDKVYLIETGLIGIEIPNEFNGLSIDEIMIKLQISFELNTTNHDFIPTLTNNILTVGTGAIIGFGLCLSKINNVTEGPWLWSEENNCGLAPVTVRAKSLVKGCYFVVDSYLQYKNDKSSSYKAII